MLLKKFFAPNNWNVVAALSTPPNEEKLFDFVDLNLSAQSNEYLYQRFPQGLFHHQIEAIRNIREGKNVCMATGTASGKSLAFFISAVEQVIVDPTSKVLAIYPMRALGREQEDRWNELFEGVGLDPAIGRIDGSVKPLSKRGGILRNCNVVVCTPDVLHAWFFSNLGNRDVQDFFKNLKQIIVDEVHTYTGVFGSNSAFLFRRLQHISSLLGSKPQFIAASATISKPMDHLRCLFGLEFSLIDQDLDTSPSFGYDIYLVDPPGESDFLTEITEMLRHLSANTDSRFITFVDSRKQVELITAILARRTGKVEDLETKEEKEDEEVAEAEAFKANVLDQLNVLPYRAGFEESDRRDIQLRLSSGTLSGVVSTSALELGIDIAHLDTCILIGVPHSQTSLQQRIGRVGRTGRGTVIVLNTGRVQDEVVFKEPDKFLDRPLGESALYLENEYIQYIHALCLARMDGEHDEIASAINLDTDPDFESEVEWPSEFIDLCTKERTGQISKSFQIMKAEAGESPSYTYPLRDIGTQFSVEIKRNRMVRSLGSLSFGQLMREAYPGAVYYYMAEPYRVYRVRVRSRQVDVRKEKYYITKPQSLPALVFPNLTADNVHQAIMLGDLSLMECDLQIREAISGFRERRGRNEFTQNYPVPIDLNIFFDQRYFTRTYFSTGVLLTHPALNNEGVNTRLLAQLMYEAFLLIIPFERQDINYSADKHRADREPIIQKDDRFLTVFDETYGSLRLSGRLMKEGVLEDVLEFAHSLAGSQEIGEISTETIEALNSIIDSARRERSELVFSLDSTELISQEQAQYERVILPGSKGLNLNRGNEEYFVDRVYLSRDGLRYEGITETHQGHIEKTSCFARVSDIVEIPAVSEVGLYNYETGQIEEVASTVEIKKTLTKVIEKSREEIDTNKLRFVLSKHFTEDGLQILCERLQLDYGSFAGDSGQEKVIEIVGYCEREDLTRELLVAAFNLHKEMTGEE